MCLTLNKFITCSSIFPYKYDFLFVSLFFVCKHHYFCFSVDMWHLQLFATLLRECTVPLHNIPAKDQGRWFYLSWVIVGLVQCIPSPLIVTFAAIGWGYLSGYSVFHNFCNTYFFFILKLIISDQPLIFL